MGVDPLVHLREAVFSLSRGDAAGARSEMAVAAAADPALRGVADTVALACAQLDADGTIEASTWDALADSSPLELRDIVESMRG